MDGLKSVRREVARNRAHVRWAMKPEVGADLPFVDGTMWTGEAKFGRRRGAGWPGGRTVQVDAPGIPRTSKVVLVSLAFGRIRDLEPTDVEGTWRLVPQAGD
jgi:hypothetical protein